MSLKPTFQSLKKSSIKDLGHHKRRRQRFQVQSREEWERVYGQKAEFGARSLEPAKRRVFGLKQK
jgi:hypothetical protein